MSQLAKEFGNKLIQGFGFGFGMTTAFKLLGKPPVQNQPQIHNEKTNNLSFREPIKKDR